MTSGSSYSISWSDLPNVNDYDIQEASDAAFVNVLTSRIHGNAANFQHVAQSPAPFFYRARGIGCDQQPGPWSAATRVVVAPAPQSHGRTFALIAPFGTQQSVSQPITISVAGSTSTIGSLDVPSYSTATSQPWLSVTPPAGTVPPDGISLTVAVDPKTLPPGTSTATLTVTSGSGTTVASVPVSITLVTPVISAPRTAPTADTLILPAVAHAAGNNAQWQSDIRLGHTYPWATKYLLTYTPSGQNGMISGQQTSLVIQPGQTIALDDVVKNWFGGGALGESAMGMLEIRTVDAVAGQGTTIASSRLYNATANGSFGQFIPAIPIAKFMGPNGDPTRFPELTLMQLAQNAAYRTNIGLVEGAGQPASVELEAFDGSGTSLFKTTVDLQPSEHLQLSGFLAGHADDIANARVAVRSIAPSGKVFAYASIIDNTTGDPFFVPAIDSIRTATAQTVLAGIAKVGSWQSDIRLFNASPASVTATLQFFPQGSSEAAATRDVVIAPGAVTAIDDALAFFDQTNTSGAIRIVTPIQTALVASARTYSRHDSGTYGQFIPGATVSDAAGIGDRSLELLQLEESSAFRTNVGIAEVTGKPAKIEVSAMTPGQKAAATITIDLQPNEFRQYNSLLRSLGLTDAYNARVEVRVTGGEGKVISYGSVIDNETQDPTYVMAQ